MLLISYLLPAAMPFTMFDIQEALTDKQLAALRDMLYHYKEFQEEIYDYPEPDTLFTKTQRELFTIFDIV